MRQLIKQTAMVVASLTMVLGLAVVPVSAEHGSDDTSGSGGSGTSGSASTSSDDSTEATTDHIINTTSSETETTTTSTDESGDDSSSGSGKLHGRANHLLTGLRQKGKEHSETARQKACEQRQANIDKRTANFATAAQRHLGVFNKIFTKVQAFHDKKQLNVTNYDSLVATVTAKQTAAQTAVDALKALDVNIDCTQTDPATTVATVKTAVSDARTALKAYRSSIKDLVVALKGASTAPKSTDSTGGDQ